MIFHLNNYLFPVIELILPCIHPEFISSCPCYVAAALFTLIGPIIIILVLSRVQCNYLNKRIESDGNIFIIIRFLKFRDLTATLGLATRAPASTLELGLPRVLLPGSMF